MQNMSERPTSLAQMLRDLVREHGSYTAAGNRLGISKSRVGQLINGDAKNLSPDLIRAVARETRYDLSSVVQAALVMFNLPVSAIETPTSTEAAVRSDTGLSKSHKRLLLAMLNEARIEVAEQRDGGEGGAASPTPLRPSPGPRGPVGGYVIPEEDEIEEAAYGKETELPPPAKQRDDPDRGEESQAPPEEG